MQILSASLSSLRQSRTSKKWITYPADVLPVWIAEMDAEPCQAVVEAVSAAVRRGDTGYPTGTAMANAFAGFAADRWDWELDPSTTQLLPDTMIGIEKLIHAYVPVSGAIVVSPPCYDSFFSSVAATNRRMIPAPLSVDGRLDLAALETAFAEAGRGSAYLLCHPQNPTGTVHTAAELTELAQLADRHQILVISDEIHAPLVHPGVQFVPYLQVPDTERGIAVVSASKSWNLAGLRAALAIPGRAAAPGLKQRQAAIGHGAQQVSVIAQIAAWSAGVDWLDQLIGELVERRAQLVSELAAKLPKVRVQPSESTYLGWLDCRALGLEHPQRHFVTRGRVALSPGSAYDPRADQFVRFNFATSPEVITEAVDRMAQSLA